MRFIIATNILQYIRCSCVFELVADGGVDVLTALRETRTPNTLFQTQDACPRYVRMNESAEVGTIFTFVHTALLNQTFTSVKQAKMSALVS